MKKITLSEIFNKRNATRVLAILMALTLLAFAGCSKGKDKDKDKDKNNNSSVISSQTQSTDSSSDATSSEETSSDASSQDTTVSSTPSYSTNTDTTVDTSSDDEDSDKDTDTDKDTDEKKEPVKIDPLKGDITVKYDFETSKLRDDEDEVKPVVDPSNLVSNYVGYAEKERKELRDEILTTENTLDLHKVKGKVYYVSTDGDDDNDGTSPKKAIRTVAAVGGLPLEEGDAVLFNRGCIFRLQEPFYSQTGITYGCYGDEKLSKPLFLGSPKNFANAIWTPSRKKNVWQTDYMYAYPSGAYFEQGKEIGYMKGAFSELKKNTDFYCDTENSILYLYCDKDIPSKAYKSIEFAQSGIRWELPIRVSDVVIDNIALRYCGEGGIRGEYLNHHITVTNCEIGFVGGAWHSTNKRYGNGIEMWIGGWNLNFNHNWIYQTFDSAISPQGNEGGDVYTMDDISISDNLLEFNNCDIEFFEQGCELVDEVTGEYLKPSRFKNWNMQNNICRFTSLGWGTRADDGGIRGIDGVFRGRSSDNEFDNLIWKNNIVDCPGRTVYNFWIKTTDQYDNWHRENNTYYIRQSIRTTEALSWRLTKSMDGLDYISANTEADTIAVFNKIEPKSKVYWYK